MSEAVFYFEFYDSQDQTRTFSIFLNDPLDREWSMVEEELFDSAALIEEEYGVHDASSSPVEGVNAIGFNTYEVEEEEKQRELMEKWREMMMEMFPEMEVSAVQQVETTLGDDDLSMLQKTKAQLGID